LTNKYLKGGMVLGANAFVVPYDGLYHFSGHCYFSSGSAASTRRGVALLRNGVLSHQGLLLVGNIAQTAAALLDLDVELTANDSIGASVFQDSGGSISATAGEFATWFSLRYVSAL
jgi:hypothetical protein